MRNTNLEEVFFPVKKEAIYLKDKSTPMEDFFAINGKINDNEKTFSVVTKNYRMIKNEEAYQITLASFQEHFKTISPDAFSVFNIIYPKSKSYVHIDVIYKSFEVNIYNREVFLPFFRITNSYNKTKRFSISVGFVRKLCGNGLIFEDDLVRLSFVHTRNQLSQEKITNALKEKRFEKYQEEFEKWIRLLSSYNVDKKYFIPLVAKAFRLNFSTKGKTQKQIRRIKERKAEFISEIIPLASEYYKEFQDTGYAIYNILTDYSSNVPEGNKIRNNQINSNQVKAGAWLRHFQSKIQDKNFNISEYLKGYEDFFVYSFN